MNQDPFRTRPIESVSKKLMSAQAEFFTLRERCLCINGEEWLKMFKPIQVRSTVHHALSPLNEKFLHSARQICDACVANLNSVLNKI